MDSVVARELETAKASETGPVEMAKVKGAKVKAARQMCSPPPLALGNTSNQE